MKNHKRFLFTDIPSHNDTIVFIVCSCINDSVFELKKKNQTQLRVFNTATDTSPYSTVLQLKKRFLCIFSCCCYQFFKPFPPLGTYTEYTTMMLCMMLLALSLSVWNKLFNLLMCRIGTLFIYAQCSAWRLFQWRKKKLTRVPSEHSTQVDFLCFFLVDAVQRITFSLCCTLKRWWRFSILFSFFFWCVS